VEESQSEHAGKSPGGSREPCDGASAFFQPNDQLLKNVTLATTVLQRGVQSADLSRWNVWRLIGKRRAN
jgi:hypothetical protein